MCVHKCLYERDVKVNKMMSMDLKCESICVFASIENRLVYVDVLELSYRNLGVYVSVSHRDMLQQVLSRSQLVVCYKAKDLLRTALQFYRRDLSWKQGSAHTHKYRYRRINTYMHSWCENTTHYKTKNTIKRKACSYILHKQQQL